MGLDLWFQSREISRGGKNGEIMVYQDRWIKIERFVLMCREYTSCWHRIGSESGAVRGTLGNLRRSVFVQRMDEAHSQVGFGLGWKCYCKMGLEKMGAVSPFYGAAIVAHEMRPGHISGTHMSVLCGSRYIYAYPCTALTDLVMEKVVEAFEGKIFQKCKRKTSRKGEIQFYTFQVFFVTRWDVLMTRNVRKERKIQYIGHILCLIQFEQHLKPIEHQYQKKKNCGIPNCSMFMTNQFTNCIQVHT